MQPFSKSPSQQIMDVQMAASNSRPSKRSRFASIGNNATEIIGVHIKHDFAIGFLLVAYKSVYET
jgi:hypothetical protein